MSLCQVPVICMNSLAQVFEIELDLQQDGFLVSLVTLSFFLFFFFWTIPDMYSKYDKSMSLMTCFSLWKFDSREVNLSL